MHTIYYLILITYLYMFQQERALILYTRAIKEGYYRLKNYNLLAASVIYISCREAGYPRLYTEIAHVTGVDVKLITKWQRDLSEHLQIPVVKIHAQALIPRISLSLRYSSCMIEYCRQTCIHIERLELLDSWLPAAVATVAIWMTVQRYIIYLSSGHNSDPFSMNELQNISIPTLCALTSTSTGLVQRGYATVLPYAAHVAPLEMFDNSHNNSGSSNNKPFHTLHENLLANPVPVMRTSSSSSSCSQESAMSLSVEKLAVIRSRYLKLTPVNDYPSGINTNSTLRQRSSSSSPSFYSPYNNNHSTNNTSGRSSSSSYPYPAIVTPPTISQAPLSPSSGPEPDTDLKGKVGSNKRYCSYLSSEGPIHSKKVKGEEAKGAVSARSSVVLLEEEE